MKGTTAIVLIAIIMGKVKSIAMMCEGRTAKYQYVTAVVESPGVTGTMK